MNSDDVCDRCGAADDGGPWCACEPAVLMLPDAPISLLDCGACGGKHRDPQCTDPVAAIVRWLGPLAQLHADSADDALIYSVQTSPSTPDYCLRVGDLRAFLSRHGGR